MAMTLQKPSSSFTGVLFNYCLIHLGASSSSICPQ
jgi:hypothetical protein